MRSLAAAEEWMTLVQEFDALGAEVLHATAEDSTRLASLLAERDVVLAALTKQMATLSLEEPAARGAANDALVSTSTKTATLIASLSDRTDAVRQELRNLGRSARAQQAYSAPSGAGGQVNARR